MQHDYHIALVVSNRQCIAIDRASENNITHIQSKDWNEIDQALSNQHIQLVVLAGFLAIVPHWFCEKWDIRIINIHPSLLPRHGGKGMYGIRVQEAVLTAGDKQAGCTIHHVSSDIDGGEIIAQATIDVEENDTPETLALRVQEQEKMILPKIIDEIIHSL